MAGFYRRQSLLRITLGDRTRLPCTFAFISIIKNEKKLAAARLPMLLALPFSASAEERELVPYQKRGETIKLDRFYALPPAQRD
jgi:hypothetical protein